MNPLKWLAAVAFGTYLVAVPLSSKAADNEPDTVLTGVYLASGVGSGMPTTASKTIGYCDDIKLYAVARSRVGDNEIYFTDADSVLVGDIFIKDGIQPFPSAWKASWLKVESDSRGKSYSNSAGYFWDHWDRLDYAETPAGVGSVIETDVNPTILDPVLLDGKPVGTMRYRLVVKKDGRKYSTPGLESSQNGGIADNVHRISRKGNTGNEIVDNAFSMCNNPYIWGSLGYMDTGTDNQAERFVGADCADFCVAAARLAGDTSMHYTSSRGMSEQADVIARVNGIRPDGIYLNGSHPVKAARPGDFIQWNGHAGILVEDSEPEGVLDSGDKVLHTIFREPRLEKIGDAYSGDFRVLRRR